MNMIEKLNNELSPELYEIINQKAIAYAKGQNRDIIQVKDIVLCFFGQQNDIPIISVLLNKFNINRSKIYSEILKLDVKAKPNIKKQLIDSSTSYILQFADRIVSNLEHPYIGIEHVLLAFLEYTGKSEPIKQIKSVLNQNSITPISFRRSIIECKKESYNLLEEIFKEQKPRIHTTKNPQQNERQDKIREALIANGYIENLNETVKRSKEKFIGREKELGRCVRILLRKKKRNVIVIGETGTGKTAFVECLSNKINEGTVPEQLKDTIIYSVHLGNIIAGTKFRGQFEERMKNVMAFFEQETASNPIIMFFDEIHTVCHTGMAEGAINASSIMKPVLLRGKVQCIGTTTFEDYRKNFLSDTALSRRFSNLFLDEPLPKEVVCMMASIKKEYESFYGISVNEEVAEYIVSASEKYIKNKNFPDKAIDVLDESCSKALADKSQSGLTKEIVSEVISEMTGVPISTVCGEEKKTLKILEEKLSKAIIGQEKAIQTVSNSIKRARLGLKDPNKPIGVFLFLGPTGTGKTLTAKTLADILFGENRMIRLDMSEYMDKTSVNKITGSAPGYVGYDEGSKLAEEIRKRPYSVVLLDEIEKAHPDVLNVFLQIFDEGRMTDNVGRFVDFRNTIIIMTSNLATAQLAKEKTMGFFQTEIMKDQKAAEDFLMDKVGKFFKPEFINRLDDVVIFNRIAKEKVFEIFDLEFGKLEKRLNKLNYKAQISNEAKIFLCEKGYNDEFGARPIIRVIQTQIETPFSNEIFLDNIEPGDSVLIDLNEEKETIFFKKI